MNIVHYLVKKKYQKKNIFAKFGRLSIFYNDNYLFPFYKIKIWHKICISNSELVLYNILKGKRYL